MSIQPIEENVDAETTPVAVAEKGWITDPVTGEKRFSDYGAEAEALNPGHALSPIWVD